MNMDLPKQVENIINTLNKAGYEAYAVGGCVRDSILHVQPKDWDITTSALPDQVKALFERTIDTGIEHGTVTVMDGKEGFEVTTYRVDGEYEDGRHPKDVTFSASLEEDLKRRDFTINAMAYHPQQGLVDLFGGIEDLNHKKIRCVGDAKERFHEDALRILRAVRFSAQLGFEIESDTQTAMGLLSSRLSMVSVERIYTEISKLLSSDYPQKLSYAYENGVMDVVLPELKEKAKDDKQLHEIYQKLANSPKDLWVRLTLLFLNLLEGKGDEKGEQVQKILRRLKTDLYTIKLVRRLTELGDYDAEANQVALRRFLAAYGKDIFDRYIAVRKAQTGKEYLDLIKIRDEILEQKDATSIKELEINGKDVLALGVKQGKEVGVIMNRLLEEVLVKPELNKKHILEEMVRSWI
ncbi:MAG: CCA tRNA nucleotidyltransferase [Lachnospiraceae bacterium]|nr:CCA tRNA nucleotidyltransferase [Lachnospiraceae bacterium]